MTTDAECIDALVDALATLARERIGLAEFVHALIREVSPRLPVAARDARWMRDEQTFANRIPSFAAELSPRHVALWVGADRRARLVDLRPPAPSPIVGTAAGRTREAWRQRLAELTVGTSAAAAEYRLGEEFHAAAVAACSTACAHCLIDESYTRSELTQVRTPGLPSAWVHPQCAPAWVASRVAAGRAFVEWVRDTGTAARRAA